MENKKVYIRDLKPSDIFLVTQNLIKRKYVLYNFDKYTKEALYMNIHKCMNFFNENNIVELETEIPFRIKDVSIFLKNNIKKVYDDFYNQYFIKTSISIPEKIYFETYIKLDNYDGQISYLRIQDGKGEKTYANDYEKYQYFENVLIDYYKKIKFLEQNINYIQDFNISNQSRFVDSIKKFYRLNKFSKEIDYFYKNINEEFPKLLSELIDTILNEIHNENDNYKNATYKNKIFAIHVTGAFKKEDFYIYIDLFNQRKFSSHIFNLMDMIKNPPINYYESNFLKIFLPIFKKYGGRSTIKNDILKNRLISE